VLELRRNDFRGSFGRIPWLAEHLDSKSSFRKGVGHHVQRAVPVSELRGLTVEGEFIAVPGELQVVLARASPRVKDWVIDGYDQPPIGSKHATKFPKRRHPIFQ